MQMWLRILLLGPLLFRCKNFTASNLEPTSLLATWKGEAIYRESLQPQFGFQTYRLASQVYRLEKKIIEEHVLLLIVTQLAAKLNMTTEQFEQAEKNKTELAASKEILGWINLSKSERAKIIEIKYNLLKRKWLNDEEKLGSFRMYVTKPDAPKLELENKIWPTIGDIESKNTIQLFTNYRCSMCKVWTQKILGETNNKLKKFQIQFVYFSHRANTFDHWLSAAAFCMQKQGNLAEFLEWTQHELNWVEEPSVLIKKLLSLGADRSLEMCLNAQPKFSHVFDLSRHLKWVQLPLPSLSVNGQLLLDDNPVEALFTF